MSRKDREVALFLHNEQLAATRATAQEQAAIERERIAVEREAIEAQREATRAQDRVNITVEEYLGMREKIIALEKEKKIADGIFARIRLPQDVLESINPETVKVTSFCNPEYMDFTVGITFRVRPLDEISKACLERMGW